MSKCYIPPYLKEIIIFFVEKTTYNIFKFRNYKIPDMMA